MTSKKEIKKQDDIDFEIQFIEAVLQKNPNFVEALTALGDLYTKRGLYEKGLQIDERLSRLKPNDPIILYNLACSYSLVNDVDRSLETIKRAIGYGYDDIEHLERDSDLENLRGDNRFKEFLSKIRNETTKSK